MQNQPNFPQQNINPYKQQSNSSLNQQQLNSLYAGQQQSSQSFSQQQSNPNLYQQNNNMANSQNFHQQQNVNISQQSFNSNFNQQQSNPNLFQQQNLNNQQLPQNINIQQTQMNASFQQNTQDSNFQNHTQNPNFLNNQSNLSFQQQVQSSNYQQIPQNSNYQQQTQNINNQQNQMISSFQQNPQNNQTNMCCQQQQQNSNITQQNSEISQKHKSFSKTKSFIIIYNNTKFIVDPVSLSNSSLKFKELIQPYIQDYEKIKSLHLEISGNQFTNRDMNNFLLLCQSQPTDVKNSEMKDICEIAKMFKADKIYNTGLDFIQKNIDATFSVDDNKYDGLDGTTYLQLIGANNDVQNDSNLNENQEEIKDETNENNENIESNEETQNPVIYTIRVVNHTFKCPTFKFILDNRILFTAKQKYNEIFIAEGDNVHIRKKENHVGHIAQSEKEKNNLISLRDVSIKLNYVNTAILGHYSIDVSFPFEDHTEHWIPRKPKFDPKTNNYYLNFSGSFNHTSLQSAKNLILQNQDGKLTYIVRKIDNNIYEVECNQSLDPLIAFSIVLSDIVGPYDDPWKTHESYEL